MPTCRPVLVFYSTNPRTMPNYYSPNEAKVQDYLSCPPQLCSPFHLSCFKKSPMKPSRVHNRLSLSRSNRNRDSLSPPHVAKPVAHCQSNAVAGLKPAASSVQLHPGPIQTPNCSASQSQGLPVGSNGPASDMLRSDVSPEASRNKPEHRIAPPQLSPKSSPKSLGLNIFSRLPGVGKACMVNVTADYVHLQSPTRSVERCGRRKNIAKSRGPVRRSDRLLPLENAGTAVQDSKKSKPLASHHSRQNKSCVRSLSVVCDDIGLLFSPALLTRGFRSEHKAAAGMPSAEHCGGPALSPTPSAKSPGRQKKHSAGTHIEDLTVTVKDAKDPSLRNLPIPIVRLAKLDMGRLFSSISADGGLKIPVSSPLKKPDKHDYEVAEVNTPQLHPEKVEEEYLDMELGLDLSLGLDHPQSSESSEDEHLISLQEMMQRAANPANTPEKTAYLEPTTPILSRRHTIPNNTCQSTATALHCRTKLDQMLKEIHCVKRSKEKETQLLSWCREEGLRGAEREEDQTIFPEHQEFLQRFSVVSNVIREVHPGELVFNLGSSGRLFSQDTLQLRHCNAQPHGAAQKTLLWWGVGVGVGVSSPAQLSLHVRIGLFEEAYHASPCPPQVSGFLFKMMSVHTERMISDKILQALCVIARSAASPPVESSSQVFEVWVPSVADMTLVLLNMGASFVTLFPLETFQPPFNEADLLNDLNMRNECPSSNPKRTFPKHNFTNVLKYLSYCMALCPRAFSDPELLLLLALSSQLGLEVLFSLEPHTDLRCLQRHVLRNVRDWEDMLPRMCRALTELTTDHHNMCSLVQLLPDHPRGKQLRRHLSVCMISKLLDGRCAEKPPGREVQLTDLSPYLSRITPSSLLRSMLSSTAQKEKEENMDTLDQQSYYLCYSLLTLVNQASNYQSYQPHQKEQLLELCSEMDRHIKRDLNKNVKCLNRSKVSDLVARIYTKWLMLIQRITPLHDKLFDWHLYAQVPPSMAATGEEAPPGVPSEEEDMEEGGSQSS